MGFRKNVRKGEVWNTIDITKSRKSMETNDRRHNRVKYNENKCTEYGERCSTFKHGMTHPE